LPELYGASFPPVPASVSAARSRVRGCLRSQGLDDLADDAALLTSELVTNAVIHARSSIDLELSIGDGHIHISVVDHGAGTPRIREPDHAGGGQGLRLVDSIADRWGHEPLHPFGKRVWFDLRTPETCDDESPEAGGQPLDVRARNVFVGSGAVVADLSR
jgi:anti-sigma regulatory factor (Ser/Thr protein kinase)